MIIDVSYWTRVLKRILYVVFILLGLIISFKLSIFYMPFLIAFIISLIIEPEIRYLMKKMNFTRKISSIIIFVIVTLFFIGLMIWGITSLISEASDLLGGLNGYINKIEKLFIILSDKFTKLNLSNELTSILESSGNDLLNTLSDWIRNFLTKLLNLITSIPTIAIYFFVTIFIISN